MSWYSRCSLNSNNHSIEYVVDYKSMDKLIHVFDKDNFKWLYSFGDIGQGPNDISSIGTIACNNDTHEISLWTMPRESCSATMLTVYL